MNVVFFDVETQRSFDEVGGRHNIRRMGLAAAVTYSTATGAYHHYTEDRCAELLAELRAVLDQRFDWPTMARWVLGRKRPLFDEAQTGEFADLFSQYVVLYYLTQVEQQIVTGDPDQVNQVRIDYRDGTSQADGSVALEVIFTTPKGTTVQTGYTLVFDAAGAAWRVRNFSVEGVSLVRNWRNELASARSREQIMELMTRKVDELRARRAAAPAAKP